MACGRGYPTGYPIGRVRDSILDAAPGTARGDVIPMYDELIGNLRAQATHFHFNDDTSLLLCKAADAIEDLQKQLYEEVECYTALCCNVQQWIPVAERLPEAGKKVLVFAYGYDTITARMCKKTEDGYPVFECKGYDGIYREMARTGRISHWMPIPQPPEDGEP